MFVLHKNFKSKIISSKMYMATLGIIDETSHLKIFQTSTAPSEINLEYFFNRETVSKTESLLFHLIYLNEIKDT